MSAADTQPQGPLLGDNEAGRTLAHLKTIMLLGKGDHLPELVCKVMEGTSASMMKDLDSQIRFECLRELVFHFNGLLKHAQDNGLDNEASTLETVCRHLTDYTRGTLKLVQP